MSATFRFTLSLALAVAAIVAGLSFKGEHFLLLPLTLGTLAVIVKCAIVEGKKKSRCK